VEVLATCGRVENRGNYLCAPRRDVQRRGEKRRDVSTKEGWSDVAYGGVEGERHGKRA